MKGDEPVQPGAEGAALDFANMAPSETEKIVCAHETLSDGAG